MIHTQLFFFFFKMAATTVDGEVWNVAVGSTPSVLLHNVVARGSVHNLAIDPTIVDNSTLDMILRLTGGRCQSAQQRSASRQDHRRSRSKSPRAPRPNESHSPARGRQRSRSKSPHCKAEAGRRPKSRSRSPKRTHTVALAQSLLPCDVAKEQQAELPVYGIRIYPLQEKDKPQYTCLDKPFAETHIPIILPYKSVTSLLPSSHASAPVRVWCSNSPLTPQTERNRLAHLVCASLGFATPPPNHPYNNFIDTVLITSCQPQERAHSSRGGVCDRAAHPGLAGV